MSLGVLLGGIIALLLFLRPAHAEPSIEEKRDAAYSSYTEFCRTLPRPPKDLGPLEYLARNPATAAAYAEWLQWLGDVLTKRKERCGDA